MMQAPHIAESEMLWTQLFKLTPGLKAGSDAEGRYFFEMPDSADRFVLSAWQMSMMAAFNDGLKTIGDIVRDIAPQFPGEVNEANVRQFCRWLVDTRVVADPNAVAVQAEPVKEVVAEPQRQHVSNEGEPVINPIAQQTNSQVAAAPKGSKKSRSVFPTLLKVAACVVVGLGTWRFGSYVVPMLHQSSQQESFVAGNALQTESKATASAQVSSTGSEVEAASHETLTSELETLREQIHQCQERRDDYYNNNDEEAYRQEIETIAKLTKRIGQVQGELATLENPKPEVPSKPLTAEGAKPFVF